MTTEVLSPIQKSRFKQLQETGKEAEFYFISNYKDIPIFQAGIIEDARLWGDGYDFQIHCGNTFYLAEIKGLKTGNGSVRLTQNEYKRAIEYKDDYVLVVVSNLSKTPKLTYIENPVNNLVLTSRDTSVTQTHYYSNNLKW